MSNNDMNDYDEIDRQYIGNRRMAILDASPRDLESGAMASSLFLQHTREPRHFAAARIDRVTRADHRSTRSANTSRLQEAPTAAMDMVRTPVLGLRKSWHVLHVLFTGSAWDGTAPSNTLVAGGREVGTDLYCGSTRFTTAAETQAFAEFVAPLCPYRLKGRIDRRRVARAWFYAAEDGDCPDLEDLRDLVLRDLPRLKSHVCRAADNGDGMLLWMM